MSQLRWTNPDGSNIEPQPFAMADLAVTLLYGARDVAQVVANTVGGVAYLVKAHANHARDKAEFKATIANTIERI